MSEIPHGSLYQMRYKTKKPKGECVDLGPINDRFGYVVSYVSEDDTGTLHLIRGTGSIPARVINGKLHRII